MPCAPPLAAHGEPDDVLVCSSAGGGLRLAVVGYEREVTAEAGHRVGLSAGAKVVHVASGPMAGADVAALRAAAPRPRAARRRHRRGQRRRAAAQRRSASRRRGCGAGRRRRQRRGGRRGRGACCRPPAAGSSSPPTCCPASASWRRRPPAPPSARPSSTHVIGGKGLSRGRGFAELVRAPTPDAVLRGVEVLADVVGGDVLVVDVGGATTDVYSVITPQGEDATIHREVVGTLWHARTVEADLGMRWTAEGVVDAAERERLALDPATARYAAAVVRRHRAPRHLGCRVVGRGGDRLDRRGGRGAPPRPARRTRRSGPDRSPRSSWSWAPAVCSGTRPRDVGSRVLARVTGDHGGGWRVPEAGAAPRRRRIRAVRRGAARGPVPGGAAAALAAPLAAASPTRRLERARPTVGR